MRLLACIIGVVLVAWPAAAQIATWKRIDGWDVNIDRSLKDGCYIFFKGTSGAIIRIGYTETRALHWFLAHDSWKSLEAGKVYQTSVSIDGRQYNGSMTGRDLGGVVALTATFIEAAMARQFLQDFMRGQTMRITYANRPVAVINLRSSHAAGEQLMACQAAADGQAPGSAPGSAPAGGDPFAPRGDRPAEGPVRR